MRHKLYLQRQPQAAAMLCNGVAVVLAAVAGAARKWKCQVEVEDVNVAAAATASICISAVLVATGTTRGSIVDLEPTAGVAPLLFQASCGVWQREREREREATCSRRAICKSN